MKAVLSISIIALAIAHSSASFAAKPATGRYKAAVDKLRELNQQYPEYSQVFSIGENDEGVEILAMRVSTTPTQVDKLKIGHVVVATHHGNESKSVDLALHFTERLLERFASNELFRGNLSETEWTLIPVLNVSGYNANQRWEHGRDSNRDYPGPCSNSAGGNLKSIRHLMTLLKTRPFTGSVTIHGYIGTLTYPWGVDTNNTHTHDHNAYASIVSKAAQENGYRHGTSTDLIYPATGTYEDYVYWKYGSWSLLVELASGNAADVRDTSKSMEVYFDGLNSSPSIQNQMTGNCNRSRVPDLHIE